MHEPNLKPLKTFDPEVIAAAIRSGSYINADSLLPQDKMSFTVRDLAFMLDKKINNIYHHARIVVGYQDRYIFTRYEAAAIIDRVLTNWHFKRK